MLDHEIAETIRTTEEQQSPHGDALGACVVDALLVGCRVCPRPSPLRDALLRAVAGATTRRTSC